MGEKFSLPQELLIDAEDKLLYITPGLESSMPNVGQLFEQVDDRYSDHPYSYLIDMEESLHTYSSTENGPTLDYSLIPGEGNEVFVTWAPFADTAPRSNASELISFMEDDGEFSNRDVDTNSWNQLTKSAITSELLMAADISMPVLTIFSPVPSGVFSSQERLNMRHGDYIHSGKIVRGLIAQAQENLHGSKSETQIDTVHLQGSSLGASHVIGAAVNFVVERDLDVKSVTAQELIVAPKNIGDLAMRHFIKGTYGDKSTISVPPSEKAIPEPLVRREVDQNSFIPAIIARIAHGATKYSQLRGLANSSNKSTALALDLLKSKGVEIVLPLAVNSGLTHDTPEHLKGLIEDTHKIIRVKAVEGQRATHMINEHANLTALLSVMNVLNAKSKA